jgi:Domain of unknown function (DUF4126)
VAVEWLLGVPVGLALSTAAGLRIFVPLLVTSVAARSGYITLTPGMTWIGSDAALVAFATALVVEVGAYYVPWLDNVLDTIATPVATGAGIVAMAAVTPDLPPLIRWTLAIVAGGGAAGLAQVSAALLRLKSTAFTAGAANPAVATAELGGAVALSLLAVLAPVLAAAAVVGLLAWLLHRGSRRRASRRVTPG